MTTYIEQQFDYAKQNNWLPTFISAAQKYNWPPEILLAIASRETNMKNIIGDKGHGFGCMQIDVNSYPEFCHSGLWDDPVSSIEKGAEVLESKRTLIGHSINKKIYINKYSFVGQPFLDSATGKGQDLLNRVSIATYNCGLWAYYCYSTGKTIDQFTTGKNYSSDVIHRATEFKKLLAPPITPIFDP